jgi:hypothetical protein
MSNYNHIPLTDDSRFSGGVDIGDAQKIKGYYEIFEQFPVHYTLCRQEKTAPYPLCGTVSLRDSQDSVLHTKGGDGKEVPARLRITLKSTDPKEVKREIAEKAQILHTRFVGTGKAAGAYIPIEQLSFAEVINMYGAEYAQARSPHNDRRQKDRLDLLRHVAEGFAAIPCQKITQRQIAELCEQLGETWYNKIREADFLMAYVAERRKYEQIANPFALYRAAHAAPRNTRQRQKAAVTTDVLTRAEQAKTVALVLEHLRDTDYVGIGLLLGTGLEAKRVVALRYGDIREDPDNKGCLILNYYRPELAGSMHNFSFVLSSLAAHICRERRKMLAAEGLSPEAIANRYVVTNSDALYPADKLTAACRNILHNCGVGYAQLAGLTSSTEGAGVRLLRSTYAQRLKEDDGLCADPTLLQYMTHRRPDGTQGVFYRGFTDPYARRCQAIAHRRIPWKNEKMTSKFTAVDGGRQSVQTVNLEDDEKTVTATVRIALKPGETVRLSSNYGIHTKWSAESDGGSVTGSEA